MLEPTDQMDQQEKLERQDFQESTEPDHQDHQDQMETPETMEPQDNQETQDPTEAQDSQEMPEVQEVQETQEPQDRTDPTVALETLAAATTAHHPALLQDTSLDLLFPLLIWLCFYAPSSLNHSKKVNANKSLYCTCYCCVPGVLQLHHHQ